MSRLRSLTKAIRKDIRPIAAGGTSQNNLKNFTESIGIFNKDLLNVPNGFAGLDIAGKIPLVNLPNVSAGATPDPICIYRTFQNSHLVVAKILNYDTDKIYSVSSNDADIHLLSLDDYHYMVEASFNRYWGDSALYVTYNNYDTINLFNRFGNEFDYYVKSTQMNGSLNAGTILIKPNVPIVGNTLTFTVNGRNIVLPLNTPFINKPSILNLPNNSNFPQSIFNSGGYTVNGSNFNVNNQLVNNVNSVWEISTTADFNKNLLLINELESGVSAYPNTSSLWLNRIQTPGTYYIRFAHTCSLGLSEWSDPVTFTVS